jgi:putative SOS response-associated peptidase YedK
MINARVETMASKPSFREAFKKRRCLIVADGFYEWAGKKGSRQPMYITLPDEKPFAFAGLWEIWHDKEKDGEAYRSCTIIMRPAAGGIERLHDRMPVILSDQAYDPWLDPGNQDAALLGRLLEEKALTELEFHPVTREVNSVGHNEPSNLEPVQMAFGF